MSASLAVQTGLVQRLDNSPGVTALVPIAHIMDRNSLPNPSPSIIIGEAQAVDEGTSLKRRITRVYHTLHVWKKEPTLQGVNAIAGAIRTAINSARLTLPEGFHCADCYVSDTRLLRDPDGETSHAVVTVETLVQEVTP